MSLFGRRKDDPDTKADAPDPAPGRRDASEAEAVRPLGSGSFRPRTPSGSGESRAPTVSRDETRRGATSGASKQSTDGREPSTNSSKGGQMAIIGKSIIFKGELTGDEDLEIDGNVEGDIKLPNHVLKIGAHGKVKASVMAKCVQVVGTVSGDVTATERVEVEASGIVEGDIRAPRLLVQEGAVINGAIEMTKAGGEARKPGESGAPPRPGTAEPARKAG